MMNIDEILEKLRPTLIGDLGWEEKDFLGKNYQETLPKLFEMIRSKDTREPRNYRWVSPILQICKDIAHRSENYLLDEQTVRLFDQYLELYPEGLTGTRSGDLIMLESIVSSIFIIYGHCPAHQQIRSILEFINSNPTPPEMLTKFILMTLHRIVRLSNNPRSYEEDLAMETLPQEISNQIIQVISNTYLQQPLSTKAGLEIIVDLNTRDVIEIVARFLRSDDDLCQIALYYLRDFWDELYLEEVAEIARRGDASWTTLAAIRVLGDHGTGEYIEQLLVDLERYSSLSGSGYKRCRDAVEKALVNLREHCEEGLVFLAIDDHISVGHRRAVKRVLKMIGEANEQRERVDYNWAHELYSWRTRKAHEEEIEYIPKILTDDHIDKLYNRQPLTYLDLLSIDGIGPYKINQYGYEILNIVNNNQLEEYKTEIPERWNLCDDVESYLINSCMEKFDFIDVSGLSKPEIAEFLKSRGGLTKGQLKKLLHEAFDSTEKEIVNSILEYLLRKIRYSETDFTLLEGGVKRGKRFALTKE